MFLNLLIPVSSVPSCNLMEESSSDGVENINPLDIQSKSEINELRMLFPDWVGTSEVCVGVGVTFSCADT